MNVLRGSASVGLVFGLMVVAAALAPRDCSAMPIDPVQFEKAGGAYALSEGLLAGPPVYVDEPLPIPEMGHIGSYKALLILIKFSDLPSVFSRASFDSMAFLGWTTGTIAQYYAEVSYNQLQLSGVTLGWYTASQTRNYYGNAQKGWGTYPQNVAKLVEEAVDAAEAAGCDFSQYDNDGDGIAESIFIVHSGEGCETSLNTNDIQSHISKISSMGGTARTYDGVTVDTYACCPEKQKTTPATHINIGVYCHEYGHILGLPDQYDTGRYCTSYTGWGLGAWALMAYGGWGGDVASPWWPTHMCPWSKIQMGWLTPTVMENASGQMVTLSPIESNQQVLKLGANSAESEYFLVAFYDSLVGFDRSLKKKGLMIFHVDDDTWTDNDCENGGSCTSGGFHYLVALEQPDASYNLDCGTANNYADRGDMFPYVLCNYFDGVRTPTSHTYRGAPSGVRLSSMAWANGGRTLMVVYVDCGALYDEIAYDDGWRDGCYTWNGYPNSGFAVKITPNRYPALVRGLEIMGCDAYNPQFKCQILDASGVSGWPRLPLSPVHTTTGAVTYAWTYEDFTADSVIVTSGDIWALYIEHNNSDLGSDTNSPWSGRTLMYYGGSFYADNGAYGNYMIRAVLDTVFCAGVDAVTPLEVRAWVGPNPFKDTAGINFSLSRSARVSLAIYDVAGRLVRDLGSTALDAGNHSLSWDGTDSEGQAAGAGIYFYRLVSEGAVHTGKLSFLR
ncbi:MAG: M6 family metalloprotease domain-containing protein [bacterium]